MKVTNIILIFCFFSILSCATINSSGYKITNKSYNTNGKKNKYYKETYCNGQRAVSWYEVDGFNNLGYVYLYLETGKYVVQINNEIYGINIDKIMPIDVAQKEALRIAQKAGFNSYSEFQKYTERQKLAEIERKKREEEQKRRETKRLRDEIDDKFGVVAIGSLLHVKNGQVKVGEVIRLGDTFSSNMNSWLRSNKGGYLFGDFNEFEIRGLDMRRVNVREINTDLSGMFSQGGRIDFGGRRGYIVKYLGTEEVITQAGLRKVIWVLECVGGNIYAE
jgi:hypothetical protein